MAAGGERDQLLSGRLRQLVRQNIPELRELERQLHLAYINKERASLIKAEKDLQDAKLMDTNGDVAEIRARDEVRKARAALDYLEK